MKKTTVNVPIPVRQKNYPDFFDPIMCWQKLFIVGVEFMKLWFHGSLWLQLNECVMFALGFVPFLNLKLRTQTMHARYFSSS